MPAIDEQIRSFVDDNFLFGQGDDLANDDSFLENGIIDSTGVLELVTFLEERFTIQIADEELVPNNLDSVTRLVDFVESKLKELGE
jgi:acyl carrier protein